MTNNEFAIAVNKFFYYAMNYKNVSITYPTLFDGDKTESIPEFFNAFPKHMLQHFLGKFNYYYKEEGCYGAIMRFYAELSGTYRMMLLKWINENYTMSEDFGISLEKEDFI